ncbi:Water stress and hypersensitive response domain-containing protein [Natronobeatus ordinarius]|uniref:Water stress and hypersensitive response domain-containing protein n=1 Tax=Natronobeatus ordinarius TaxID=2963433 RepID=UPI0020CC3AA9|nr:Water stress and hypersensitive response domain-containing protein [Natronobeatus ordinarius]
MFRRAAAVVAALVVGVAVLLGGLFAAGVLGVPDAGLEDNAWGEVDDERIEVVTTVWIDNPNPGLSAGDAALDYALALNDVRLAEGSKAGIDVPEGNHTTTLHTDLYYERIPVWWVTHIENDEVSDLAVEAQTHVSVGPLSGSPTGTHTDTVETDLEELIADSLTEMEGEHTASPVELDDGPVTETVEPRVVIEDTDAEWGAVTEDETELHATFHVHNPNPYPLATPAFTGDLELNDVPVAAWDAGDAEVLEGPDDAIILPGETEELTFAITLDNDRVAEWFATHVDADERSVVAFTAQLAVSVNGHTVTVPADGEAVRCTYEMQTAIFVDQESGLEREGCALAPWLLSGEDLERVGATIDLLETDWWEGLLVGVLEPAS